MLRLQYRNYKHLLCLEHRLNTAEMYNLRYWDHSTRKSDYCIHYLGNLQLSDNHQDCSKWLNNLLSQYKTLYSEMRKEADKEHLCFDMLPQVVNRKG